jgi:hypothetical protein
MIVRAISCRTAVLLDALAVADAAAAQQATSQAGQLRQRELLAPDPIKNSLGALRGEMQGKKRQHGVGYTKILDQPARNGQLLGRLVSISPRSTRRENSVAPPEARMRACSTQFSRSMRPLKSSDWLTRSMSWADQLAICS